MKLTLQKIKHIIKEELNEVQIFHSRRGTGNPFKFKLEKILNKIEQAKEFYDLEELVEITDEIYNELTKYKTLFPEKSDIINDVIFKSDTLFDKISLIFDSSEESGNVDFKQSFVDLDPLVQELVNSIKNSIDKV